MQKREKILLGAAAAVVLLLAGMPKIKGIFVEPIDVARSELTRVEDQLADQTPKIVALKVAGQTLKAERDRSLPPNPRDAQRLYQVWLSDLANMSGIESPVVAPGSQMPRANVFTGVHVSVQGRATLSTLCRFLYHFYRADLPHRLVNLAIESPASQGDPVLQISLTAEGLSFPTAPKRAFLFPQTTLAREHRSGSGAQTIEVADAAGFPEKAGYRIRIGNEYLTVTAAQGTQWTVVGGVDATRPGSHQAGDVVELAPVHPDYASRTPDDYRKLVENSPFVKPVPRSTAPVRQTTPSGPPTPPRTIVRSDSAAETYLRGTITEDEEPQAWLYGKPPAERIVVRRGSKLEVGDVAAVVLDIQADHVLLESSGSVWKLELGDNLRSMQKQAPAGATGADVINGLPQPSADDGDEPVEAPVPGADGD